ncbi:fungal specific transcription factor domain-containing protein [Aspergillus ibericus CBS 121593]|uniref:Transcription factor domain-containing protein n=1 Tax=Aspergillus ibericus CBS 121593 TaxID=1448316 RepID=A0A395GK35_9EURO|nr:hypothetical protein BO80DRAFT_450092 [Aspergillus ibericus CBS 121593]RAK95596.1 hypothetical protein BO80DRAFT_450092 [Aspergillus ibericus CBS 121593]
MAARLEPRLARSRDRCKAKKTRCLPYFEHVHPLYPFLDRNDFKNHAFDNELADHLTSNAPFSALYPTVLALDCLYVQGGSFDTGKGKAWRIFQHALGLFPEILLPPEALLDVQGIFAMNFSCIQISRILITEAARMVQCLGYSAAVECFFCSRAPVSLAQATIAPRATRSDDAVDRRSEQAISWTEPSGELLPGQTPLQNSMDVLHSGINATSMGFDELFYPSDPRQPTMGTLNPPASELSALVDFSFWS